MGPVSFFCPDQVITNGSENFGVTMQHPSLFHESLEDALRDVIQASGGPKIVASRLWPDKAPEAARRSLLDCLNEDGDWPATQLRAVGGE